MTKSTFSNSINIFINRYRLKQLRPFLLHEKVVLWSIKSAVHPTTNSPSLFIVKYRLEILLTALYVFIYFFVQIHIMMNQSATRQPKEQQQCLQQWLPLYVTTKTSLFTNATSWKLSSFFKILQFCIAATQTFFIDLQVVFLFLFSVIVLLIKTRWNQSSRL